VSDDVYHLFNESGSVTNYKKVSARLPAFLEQYGPKAGYSLIGEVTDLLGIQPGKLALLQENKTTIDKEDTCLIFTRKLLKDGQVVATASALKIIQEYKDYESGETAALQRLLALLGFGGESLDDDEEKDFKAQNLKASSEPSPTPTPKEKPKPTPIVKESVAKEEKVTQPSATVSKIPTSLSRQLQHMAKVKGVSTNPCSTRQEANTELQRLKAL